MGYHGSQWVYVFSGNMEVLLAGCVLNLDPVAGNIEALLTD